MQQLQLFSFHVLGGDSSTESTFSPSHALFSPAICSSLSLMGCDWAKPAPSYHEARRRHDDMKTNRPAVRKGVMVPGAPFPLIG